MDYKIKSKSNTIIIICAALVSIIAVVCIILFLTKGSTVVSGSYPENQKSVSLRCSADGFGYPFFRYDESNSKNTKIYVIFYENAVDSISINHTLYYDNIEESTGSEAQNHASMGIHFAEDGLGADPFSAHYSKQQDKMSMTLYAKAQELNNVSSKYFLIKDISVGSSIDEYMEMYKVQGFSCLKSD